MRTISCTDCGELLPDSAEYCAKCGAVSLSSKDTLYLGNMGSAILTPVMPTSLENKEMPSDEATEKPSTQKLEAFRDAARASFANEIQEYFDGLGQDPQDNEAVEQRETWQKVVEQKTPVTLPAVMLPPIPVKKRISQSIWPHFLSKKPSPRPVFWACLIGLLVLLLGGAFGVAISFGREQHTKTTGNLPVLQASPTTIALGGIVTLRGMHFAGSEQLGLSYDQHILLLDTGGVSTVQTDAHGSFSDTVIIDPSWHAGMHALYVTSTHTHQQAQTSILVTGQSALQGPPHLLLSANTLNLGSGDETTNGNALLALSNAGGGQLNWQSSISQPWLQISPRSGSIASGKAASAIVAAERANLAPGSYTANIVFTSNTEQVTLQMNMQVIPLLPIHQAILRLSPAALTFTGSAGGANPQSQVITVSNPGSLPLTWGTTIYLQNGSGWLSVVPTNDRVEPGGYENLLVNVNTKGLAPGVYKGQILFSNWGTQTIQGNAQSVYVSLTVTAACTLAMTPDNLSFTDTVGQTAPAAQALSIGVAQGCGTSQQWNASVSTITGGQWLQINQANGSTPSQIQVSVNPTGLGQGTYTGTITFITNTGSQMVSVTLTLNPVPCAITAPSTLALQGTAGMSASGTVTLDTTGTCPHMLNWTAQYSVTTPSGGTWLSGTPSGTLTQPATASANVLASLVGLSEGTYTGTMTISATDSVTNQFAGMAQVAITLTVQPPPPPCTLQPPSASTLNFSASVGTNPANQSFTISAIGSCSGNITITASGDSGSTGWLAVSPASASMSSGGQITLTVTITSSALAAGSYSATITLGASDANGALVGSPQSVTVLLKVQ
jgi:hypothetical protein